VTEAEVEPVKLATSATLANSKLKPKLKDSRGGAFRAGVGLHSTCLCKICLGRKTAFSGDIFLGLGVWDSDV